MSAAPIYVVVASDDLNPKYRARELERNPGRKPNPIVFETDVNRATLENARARAASLDGQYGATRVGRVVFEGEPGFEVKP
jgi:hypothetical protein